MSRTRTITLSAEVFALCQMALEEATMSRLDDATVINSPTRPDDVSMARAFQHARLRLSRALGEAGR